MEASDASCGLYLGPRDGGPETHRGQMHRDTSRGPSGKTFGENAHTVGALWAEEALMVYSESDAVLGRAEGVPWGI